MYQKRIGFKKYSNIELENIRIDDIIKGRNDDYKIKEIIKYDSGEVDFIVLAINGHSNYQMVVFSNFLYNI